MGNLSHPGICWKGKTAGHKHSRRSPHWWKILNTDDQGADQRRYSDGSQTYKKKDWSRMWRLRAALAAMTMRCWNSGSWKLGTREIANSLGLQKRRLWRSVLGKIHEIWPQKEERSRTAGWFQRSPWPSSRTDHANELLSQVRMAGLHRQKKSSWQKSNNKEAYKMWKQRKVMKENRDTVWPHRKRIKKVKAHLWWNLAKNRKCNKTGFYNRKKRQHGCTTEWKRHGKGWELSSWS